MKNLFFLALALLLGSCTAIKIPAGQSLEIDYPDYENYTVRLNNKTNQGFDVKMVNKTTGEKQGSFGIGRKAKVDVNMQAGNKLVLQNNSTSEKRVSWKVSKTQKKEIKTAVAENTTKSKKPKNTNTVIRFTLANESAKNIPLIIPSVMNPNLSPFSASGVDLQVGQEIFFKVKGKKYLLLSVDDSIQQDSTLDVAALLKKRKQELGL